MANVAYSDLTAASDVAAPTDLIPGTDVSDTSADPAGTTKKFTAKQVRGRAIVSKTANYTITVSDYTVLGNTSGGDITFTLPAAASSANAFLYIKKTHADNLLTIDGNGSETIDGSTTLVIANNQDSVCLHCDGSTWHVVSFYSAPHQKHFGFANASIGSGGTKPTETTVGTYLGYAYTIGDDSIMVAELPHDLDVTQDLEIHLSWLIDEAYATNSAEVQFQIDYALTPHDETEAADAPTHSGTLTSGDLNIPATAKTIAHVTGLTIPAADIASVHDVLALNLSRIALVGGTNPTAEPVVIEVTVEYQRRPFVNDN